jgi:prevent-host-death family protein
MPGHLSGRCLDHGGDIGAILASNRQEIDRGRLLAYAIPYAMETMTMTSITATEARKRLYTLVDDVAESHVPIQIAGRRNSAVLISEEDWRAIQETLYLSNIPGMRASIRKGLKTPVDECSQQLKW